MQVEAEVYMYIKFIVGMASLSSKMFLLFVFFPKFPFKSWTIVHGDQKIESAQKIKQVEIDEKCMQANFGRHDLSGFRDFAHFSNGQLSLSNHGL